MQHVVMFSGGVGSWGAARRVVAQYGSDSVTLLFADTNIEDEDLYRFLKEAAADVGGNLVWLDNDGKTPWDVFREVRFLGNTRVAPCSHKLKQEPARQWVVDNCTPQDTVIYVGIDWTEEHRLAPVRAGWEPWTVRAPLCEEPLISKDDLFKQLADAGIARPRLYEMGFPHNNCGGGCVKAGQAHFKHLKRNLPERFQEWADNEQGVRDYLGRDDIAILRDRSGGTVKPLPLYELARRDNRSLGIDEDDWGGCGCFIDS